MKIRSFGEKVLLNMADHIKDIIVIEDCIQEDHQDNLEKLVTGSNFPWFFYPGTILPTDVEYTNECIVQKGSNPPQFSHFLTLEKFPFVNTISPVLDTITSVVKTNIRILKIKFNLLTKSSNTSHHWPHTDLDNLTDDVRTGLYYVNDSDGPTYIFNEYAPKVKESVTEAVKINPEKGKLVIFDSRRFHASSSPNIHNARIVLNVVFTLSGA